MHLEMNNSNNDLEKFKQHSEIKIGQILAANYPNETNEYDFHRGKIISIDVNAGETLFKVS